MTRYSKKDREDAALICAIAASRLGARQYYDHITEECGIGRDVLGLALGAWAAAHYSLGPWTHETDAEAEALLQSGWTP